MRIFWVIAGLLLAGTAYAQASDPWKTAFESTFTTMDRKDEGDGVIRYVTCFKPGTGKSKCDAVAFMRRDGFRKLYFLVKVTRAPFAETTALQLPYT